MRKIKHVVVSIIMIVFAGLVTVGCKKASDVKKEDMAAVVSSQPVEGEVTTDYGSDFLKLEVPSDMTGANYGMYHGNIYYGVTDFDAFCVKLKVIDTKSMESRDVTELENMDGMLPAFGDVYVYDDGSFSCVVMTGYDNQVECYLYDYSNEGKQENCVKISISSEDFVHGICVAQKGRVFFGGFYDGGKSFIKECNVNTGDLLDLYGVPNVTATCVGPDRDTDGLLLSCEDALYEYDFVAESANKILDWQNVDIVGSQIKAIEKYGDNIFVLTENGGEKEYVVISEKEEEVTSNKNEEPQKIVIATTMSNQALSSAIGKFNREQKEYKVELKKYQSSDVYISTEEDVENMLMDLVAGEQIDLVDVNSFNYYGPSNEDLIRQEYVENLYPYLESSKQLSADEFEEKVLDLCSEEDFLIAIPYAYSIYSCVVDGDIFGDSVSVRDIIEYDRAHPEKCLFAEAGEYAVMDVLLENNLGNFIDWEKGTCDFNSEDFRLVAEYAKEYAGKQQIYNFMSRNKIGDILRFSEVERIDEAQLYRAWNFEGRGRFIGMPTFDGKMRTIMKPDINGASLAITKNSASKDGAWKFIEYYLEYEQGLSSGLSVYGIPSRKAYAQKMIEFLASEDEDGPLPEADVTYSPGTDEECVVHQHPFSEEDEKEFYKLIDNAETKKTGERLIMGIIEEELGSYMGDQKTLDEVIGVIQSRVGLYLAENK